MNKTYIEWHNATFIVVDAEQPAEALLSVIRHYKIAWVVLRLDKKDTFYVFKRVELEGLLKNKRSNKPAYMVLGLREEDASSAVIAGKKGHAPDRALLDSKKRLKLAHRLVRLDRSGRVKAVGEFSTHVKRGLRRPGSYRATGGGSLRSAGGSLVRSQRERAQRAFALPGRSARHLGRKEGEITGSAPGTKGAMPRTTLVSRDYNLVRMFYATDRAVKSTGADGNTVYANERSGDGKLKYGTCDVSIPLSHKKGEIEAPSIWKFEFRAHPEKHFVVLRTVRQGHDAFFQEMRDKVGRSKPRSAFVFVHGYKVCFEEAAKRTAQLAFDLRFPGAPILYSWPSKAAVKAYVADGETIDLTKEQLVRFLADVAKESGANVVHLIAHSMGNRALARALDEMASRLVAKDRPKFRQIVLTAPDINRAEFLLLQKGVRRMGRRVTLYGSSKDIPLYFSKRVNEYDRVGYFGREIMIVKNIDTIDASSVKTDFLAHTPVKGKTVLLDLFDLIWHGLPPDERPALEKKTIPNGDYWEFAE